MRPHVPHSGEESRKAGLQHWAAPARWSTDDARGQLGAEDTSGRSLGGRRAGALGRGHAAADGYTQTSLVPGNLLLEATTGGWSWPPGLSCPSEQVAIAACKGSALHMVQPNRDPICRFSATLPTLGKAAALLPQG